VSDTESSYRSQAEPLSRASSPGDYDWEESLEKASEVILVCLLFIEGLSVVDEVLIKKTDKNRLRGNSMGVWRGVSKGIEDGGRVLKPFQE
jgi:hypothetical protein